MHIANCTHTCRLMWLPETVLLKRGPQKEWDKRENRLSEENKEKLKRLKGARREDRERECVGRLIPLVSVPGV